MWMDGMRWYEMRWASFKLIRSMLILIFLAKSSRIFKLTSTGLNEKRKMETAAAAVLVLVLVLVVDLSE